MKEPIELTELQLSVMRVLWERKEATVAEVHQRLQKSRALAPTTVATLLSRLETRGVVRHRTAGRQYVYRANVSETEVQQSMLGEMNERLFGGDVAAMVSQLLGSVSVDRDELVRIRALLEKTEREMEESRNE